MMNTFDKIKFVEDQIFYDEYSQNLQYQFSVIADTQVYPENPGKLKLTKDFPY